MTVKFIENSLISLYWISTFLMKEINFLFEGSVCVDFL